MADLRLVIITDNQEFQTNAQNILGEKQPSSEVFQIPAPMRAPGVISMLNPTHVALDLSLLGADAFLDDIRLASQKIESTLVFFATRHYQGGEKIAESQKAMWCPNAKAEAFTAWLLNGCAPVEDETSSDDDLPKDADYQAKDSFVF